MGKADYRVLMNGVAQLGAATALLCLPAIRAGRPQPFSDSKSYYALGEATSALVAHPDHDPDAGIGASLRGPRPRPDTVHVGQDRQTSVRLAYTVAASRSPYWSVLFYLAAATGTAWLVVVAQALVAALTIRIAVRAFEAGRAYLPIIAALTLASSLPVEVMFLMPDLFAGLVILAAATLAVRRKALPRWEMVTLWIVMAAGALFHTSHLLVLAALGLASALAGRLRRPAPPRAPRAGGPFGVTVLILSAAAVGLVGAVGYPLAVRMIRHEPVYAPPFLAARLIADGPGRAVLRRDCASGDAWGWCRYENRPLTDVNVILWSTKPAVASFQAADYDQRVRIISEQPQFVATVIRSYPRQVLKTVAANVGSLLFRYGTFETLDDRTALFRDPDFSVLTRIVPGATVCARRGDCRLALNIAALDSRIGWALVASCLVVVALMTDGRRRWLPGLVAVIGGGLLFNAIICGLLSGDSQRYQSRITWLVPLVAMVGAAGRFASTRRPTAAASGQFVSIWHIRT